jgi:urea transport system ATP-binding protein
MLKVDKLSTSYGSVKVLHGVSLTAAPGQITCVMGRNGVGKTTLMKSIMGSLKSTAGKVMMNGRDLTALPSNKRARSGIALVPQGRHIFPKLTVMENLRVGLEARPDRSRKMPEAVFEYFPVLKTMSHRMGGDLSGGQQQQLAIARALVGDPKVLLLDEPTEGIQPNIIQLIGQVLRKLVTEMRMAVVLVEQYLDFVREFGHAFHIMNRGQVIASGTPSELTEEMVSMHLSV